MGSGSHWAVLRYPVAIIGGRRDVAVDVCDPAPVAFIVVIHREGWLDAIGDVGHDGEQSRPERRANLRRRGDEETPKHEHEELIGLICPSACDYDAVDARALTDNNEHE